MTSRGLPCSCGALRKGASLPTQSLWPSPILGFDIRPNIHLEADIFIRSWQIYRINKPLEAKLVKKGVIWWWWWWWWWWRWWWWWLLSLLFNIKLLYIYYSGYYQPSRTSKTLLEEVSQHAGHPFYRSFFGDQIVKLKVDRKKWCFVRGPFGKKNHWLKIWWLFFGGWWYPEGSRIQGVIFDSLTCFWTSFFFWLPGLSKDLFQLSVSFHTKKIWIKSSLDPQILRKWCGKMSILEWMVAQLVPTNLIRRW